MTRTGKKVCNDREILWDAKSQGFHAGVIKVWYGWMMFMGITSSAWILYIFLDGSQAKSPAQRVRSLELLAPFLASGLVFILASVCGFLWQDYLAFDLPRRRYFRRRGIGRWAKNVVSGDFADFAHIQVDSGNDCEDGLFYVVSLVWAETVGRRGLKRFVLGNTSSADQAAALAAELAVPLNIPVQEKWLWGKKPTLTR